MLRGFNSNMVRLRDPKDVEIGQIYESFNSNMVRLRAHANYDHVERLLSFNSNMVRLRAHIDALNTHAGNVSIPIWCD